MTVQPDRLTAVTLDAIEARANAATPGPWTWLKGDGPPAPGWRFGQETGLHELGYAADAGDACFIAASRTDVPVLTAELRRLQDRETELAGVSIGWVGQDGDAASLRVLLAMLTSQSYLSLAGRGCRNSDVKARVDAAVRARSLRRRMLTAAFSIPMREGAFRLSDWSRVNQLVGLIALGRRRPAVREVEQTCPVCEGRGRMPLGFAARTPLDGVFGETEPCQRCDAIGTILPSAALAALPSPLSDSRKARGRA